MRECRLWIISRRHPESCHSCQTAFTLSAPPRRAAAPPGNYQSIEWPEAAHVSGCQFGFGRARATGAAAGWLAAKGKGTR